MRQGEHRLARAKYVDADDEQQQRRADQLPTCQDAIAAMTEVGGAASQLDGAQSGQQADQSGG
jgi:hypothetical protein